MKKVMYLAASAAALVLASCGGADQEAARKKRETDSLALVEQARQDSINKSMELQTVDVYATVKANPDFSTLVSLLDQAGLAATLQDANVNFTLFAPTNAAFDKMDAKALADLKDPKNAEKLKDVLLYHVVRGKLMASDVAGSGELQAMDDKVITVKNGEAGTVMVANASVISADMDATNGVVHTLDAVMSAPAKKGKAKTKTPVTTTDSKTEDPKTSGDKISDKMSGGRENETGKKVEDKMGGSREKESENKINDKMNRNK